jgi:hypothetical protein
MNRRTIALKVFTIALITVLYLIFFSISLVIRANANERVRMAYISDSPTSSFPMGSPMMPAFSKNTGWT